MKKIEKTENYFALTEKVMGRLAHLVSDMHMGLRSVETALHMRNGMLGRMKKQL